MREMKERTTIKEEKGLVRDVVGRSIGAVEVLYALGLKVEEARGRRGGGQRGVDDDR